VTRRASKERRKTISRQRRRKRKELKAAGVKQARRLARLKGRPRTA